MKVAPVSADLLIKLALAAAVVGGAWYLANRARNALGDMLPDWSMPDVGAWVDGAGRFAGDVGSTLNDGAAWVATYGGTTPFPNYDPSTWAPLDPGNTFGIGLTPEQRAVHDAMPADDRNLFEYVWGWAKSLNPAPADLPIGYGAIDARRIDRQHGY